MSAVTMTDPEFRSALDGCVHALRSLADYELEPELERRMTDLGERKEFLSVDEHDELKGLVAFARRRSIESLEAKLAIQRLRGVVPDLADES